MPKRHGCPAAEPCSTRTRPVEIALGCHSHSAKSDPDLRYAGMMIEEEVHAVRGAVRHSDSHIPVGINGRAKHPLPPPRHRFTRTQGGDGSGGGAAGELREEGEEDGQRRMQIEEAPEPRVSKPEARARPDSGWSERSELLSLSLSPRKPVPPHRVGGRREKPLRRAAGRMLAEFWDKERSELLLPVLDAEGASVEEEEVGGVLRQSEQPVLCKHQELSLHAPISLPRLPVPPLDLAWTTPVRRHICCRVVTLRAEIGLTRIYVRR